MANSVIIIFLLIIPRLSELRRLRRMQDYWQQTKFSMKFSVKSWWHKGQFSRELWIEWLVVHVSVIINNLEYRKIVLVFKIFLELKTLNISTTRHPTRYSILAVVTGSRVIPWTHLDGGQNVPSPWQLHFGCAPARPLPTRNARTSNCDEKHHEPPTRGSGLNAAGSLNSTFQFLHICTRLHQSQSTYLSTCI